MTTPSTTDLAVVVCSIHWRRTRLVDARTSWWPTPAREHRSRPGREEERERNPVDSGRTRRRSTVSIGATLQEEAAPIAPASRGGCAVLCRSAARRRAEAPGPNAATTSMPPAIARFFMKLICCAICRLRHGPEVVEDDGGEQSESSEGDDGLARVEAGHQRQAAAELDDDGQRREQLRQRQALAGDVAGGAVESGDLGEAGEDEDQAEQDAADENGGALQKSWWSRS